MEPVTYEQSSIRTEHATMLLDDAPENELKNRITAYWTKRSEGFAELKHKELHGEISDLWLAEIRKYIPQGKSLDILDVGTGSGFFSLLLAKQGHRLTGIDLTPSMIESAKKLAANHQIDADFMVMDAENLAFPDETFDVVISRNLTWTLPHPEQAYSEWLRVLKKGGIILNFDADYGNEKTADFHELPTEHAHNTIGLEMMQENDRIKEKLSISRFLRPAWDVQTLLNLGIEKINVDTGVGKRIYKKKDIFYNPTPIFTLYAVKE
ncbi:MAG: methyltransferase domain-containing protein [Lachnospiraceae bacterium]|nr:methyltransferase domain-containing protein [Lachnospiraceae bacterium]